MADLLRREPVALGGAASSSSLVKKPSFFAPVRSVMRPPSRRDRRPECEGLREDPPPVPRARCGPSAGRKPRCAICSARLAFLLDHEDGRSLRLMSRDQRENAGRPQSGESPIVGSSMINSLGAPIRARAMATICCSPPDRVPACCPSLLRHAREERQHAIQILLQRRRDRCAGRRPSSGSRARSIAPKRRAPPAPCDAETDDLGVGRPRMDRPSKRTSPAVVGASPRISFIVVDLPLALPPSRPDDLACRTSRGQPEMRLDRT